MARTSSRPAPPSSSAAPSPRPPKVRCTVPLAPPLPSCCYTNQAPALGPLRGTEHHHTGHIACLPCPAVVLRLPVVPPRWRGVQGGNAPLPAASFAPQRVVLATLPRQLRLMHTACLALPRCQRVVRCRSHHSISVAWHRSADSTRCAQHSTAQRALLAPQIRALLMHVLLWSSAMSGRLSPSDVIAAPDL